MDQHTLESTRQMLHGVAEYVLAGPQYVQSQTIRLRVTSRGFGTVAAPVLRVEGLELVTPRARVPLGGTYAGLARASGVEARPLRDVYADGPGVAPDQQLMVDPEAATVVMDAFARGDAAMRAFAPDQQPVLWPEHFDVGIALGEVNYGASPGDAHVPEPYAYVGPWAPREGAFWNSNFGAMRLLTEVPDADSLVAFFQEGATRAAVDRPRAGLAD